MAEVSPVKLPPYDFLSLNLIEDKSALDSKWLGTARQQTIIWTSVD